jgi:two-component system cell cycle sensor histidine kinase/response regulator CckA
MRPEVPVVFMSGYAEDVFKSQGARIEASAFLAKPFSLTELTTIVNQQLAIQSAIERQTPVQ